MGATCKADRSFVCCCWRGIEHGTGRCSVPADAPSMQLHGRSGLARRQLSVVNVPGLAVVATQHTHLAIATGPIAARLALTLIQPALFQVTHLSGRHLDFEARPAADP